LACAHQKTCRDECFAKPPARPAAIRPDHSLDAALGARIQPKGLQLPIAGCLTGLVNSRNAIPQRPEKPKRVGTKTAYFLPVRKLRMNWLSLILILVVGGIGCVGGGFMSLAMLHWAWKGQSARDPVQGWPLGRRLLVAGAILGIVFGVLKLVLWQRLQV
jgi:hypothetical protein